MRNKETIGLIIAIVALIGGLALGTFLTQRSNVLPELPKPELSEGQRGQLGIDKNINESTIDKYLYRDDSVYYDVRMLEDPANYEEIGGDRYLSGLVDGFEVVSYPYLVNVEGLPEAVGSTYTGKTLFTQKDGKYTANYEESQKILEDLFPKDKNIFLMCGGGGYSGMTKNMLTSLGWNGDKIYVVGGYWYYEGEHDVKIKQDDGSYAFWKIAYHDIDFDKLTEKK
jgi:rhodanese-related sulfurtransferase